MERGGEFKPYTFTHPAQVQTRVNKSNSRRAYTMPKTHI